MGECHGKGGGGGRPRPICPAVTSQSSRNGVGSDSDPHASPLTQAGLLYQESYVRFWELLSSAEASKSYLALLMKEVFRLRVGAPVSRES